MVDRQLILAYNSWATGTQPSGWRHPHAIADGTVDPGLLARTAEIAERGLFDYYFLGTQLYTRPHDPLALPKDVFRIDGHTLVSYLAARTSHIGLVPTFNASFSHPFTVARELASLDHLSGGRAGLHIITGRDPFAARNYGYDGPDERDVRYERIAEFVEVLRLLWDSWEDDAVLLDKTLGDFVNPERAHEIDYEGAHYRVQGPLNVPRPPQGQLPILHAGQSGHSQAFGSVHADGRFAPLGSPESARALYGETKRNVAAAGRDPDAYPVIAGATIYTAETTGEARSLFREVQRLSTRPYDGEAAASLLSVEARASITGQNPDASVVGLLGRSAFADEPHVAEVAEKLGTDDLTLRDLSTYATNNASSVLVGGADEIAARLADGLADRQYDGITFFPPFNTLPFDLFVDLIVPRLQRAGVYKREYTAPTLRDALGIGPARPNVFAAAPSTVPATTERIAG